MLERAAEIGGAVRTAEVTLPGFKHDLFASNLSIFARSPAYLENKAAYDAAGLQLLSSKAPFASIYARGSVARAYTDPELSAREMAKFSPKDRDAWSEVCSLYKRIAPQLMPMTFSLLPSVDMLGGIIRMVARSPLDSLNVLRIAQESPRQFADRFFTSDEVKGLLLPWALHLDFGPEVRGGAMFAFVAAMSASLRGLVLAKGGAGKVTEALVSLLESEGVQVLTNSEVDSVTVRGARAVGVRVLGGGEIAASRAVVASVTPRLLFGRLVAEGDVPSGFLRRVRKFRYGPGTFVVHLALGRELEWRAAEDLGNFNYVHVCADREDLERTYAQSLSGYLPERPLMVVSQTTQLDPSRAPAGQHVARIHARAVPTQIVGDSAGRLKERDWKAVAEPFADRLIDLLEQHVPNIKDVLLARHVVSPLDLESQNANLAEGDCVSGSHHLDQNYWRRPFLGWSRYATPVKHLYMIGASTWPGGGVNGASGYLLAQQLVRS